MTMPKKGTRAIQIDSVRYRWKADMNTGFSPPMTSFVAEADMKPSRSSLQVMLWQRHVTIVTPEIASTLIRAARSRGWDPFKNGNFRIGPDDAKDFFGRSLPEQFGEA
jgi:hypothetical protein